MAETPWGFEQTPDGFTVSVGVGEGRPIRLAVSHRDAGTPGAREAKLLAHARSLGVPFKKGATAGRVVEEFLKNVEVGRGR